ncbi:hypothetical protein Ahy_A03g012281 isoform A [Arachis hypogaea]|uniref:DDT domain-containing protein n=1 Tax=Arachis hypogaea TaxID=3818 RepID=A0A445DSY4_ARAHY|nr:hypothetical protein Ahy_A03g012281 isoform A [Arachis hypogaea]
MPLLRRKPFSLADPPKDLKPDEHVYQIRFTKEIFRDYNSDYLNRINLYRQRIWMCKVTGKTNLTYEEALVSEKSASEKVQQFPKELRASVLRIIQYSMLPLKDLADFIAEKLEGRFFVGAELHGKKDNELYPCRILKVIPKGVDKFYYEVAWLDKDKNIGEKAEVNAKDLVLKKPLFSRNMLKSFIRESTYRNAPWVLHEEVAKNHGISTDIPEELRGRVCFKNGLLTCSKKRKTEESLAETENCKRKKLDGAEFDGSTEEQQENGQHKVERIKYPIDDLLVKPSPHDPVLANRPSPSRDFNVPMNCVGNLLMVWDFCTTFGKVLHLLPYSLEDFENAICHKDSNIVLLVESHAALFRVLIQDDSEYTEAVKNRRTKSKITMVNWTEYLCHFLEMINVPELRQCEATIKRGHYGLVDINAKLEILCELVNRVIETTIFREKLGEIIEQRHVLGVSRREEVLEDARKRKKEKETLKAEIESNEVVNGHHLNSENVSSNSDDDIQNGHIGKKRNGERESSSEDNTIGSLIKHSNPAPKNMPKSKKPNSEPKQPTENGKELPKQFKSDKDSPEKNSKEQRKEYFEREMEKRPIRRSPLGKDRNYNRYWWFRRDGRIFVENSDSKEWGYYSSKEELDAFMGSLNCKGERERALRNQLEKYYSRVCSELQKRSKDLMHRIAADESVLRRSTRVRAPPRQNPANAFLNYVNKWKVD